MATEIPGQILPVVDEKKLADPIWYEWFTYLRGAVKSLVTFQTSAEGAWTAYTPTVSALTGTFTTASASGRYKTIGKTVFIHVTLTITTVGTGTHPLFTLPVTPLDFNFVRMIGQERLVNGFTVNGRYSSGSTMAITNYDNSNPSASGRTFELSGVYEAA